MMWPNTAMRRCRMTSLMAGRPVSADISANVNIITVLGLNLWIGGSKENKLQLVHRIGQGFTVHGPGTQSRH